MRKEKPFKTVIPKLYKRAAEDLLLYAYVTGVQRALPDVSTKKAIELFMKEFDLSESDYPYNCAYTTFGRIRKEHYVLQKSQ